MLFHIICDHSSDLKISINSETLSGPKTPDRQDPFQSHFGPRTTLLTSKRVTVITLTTDIYLHCSCTSTYRNRVTSALHMTCWRNIDSAPFQDAFKTNGQFQNLSQPIKFLKPFYDFLICENPMPTSLTFYRIPAQPLGCSNIHLQLSNDNTVATKLKLACLDSNMH